MFSKTLTLTGLIAAIGLICFSITPASAGGGGDCDDDSDDDCRRVPVQVIGTLEPCLEGQVPKKQANGSWACEADIDTNTNAAKRNQVDGPRGPVAFDPRTQEIAPAQHLLHMRRDGDRTIVARADTPAPPEILAEQIALARKNVAKNGWLNPYLVA